MKIQIPELRRLMEEVCIKNGLNEEQTKLVVDEYLESQLKNKLS